MQAQIMSFRRGRHTQTDNQMILQVENVASKEDAEKLIGKKVTWTADGKNKTAIQGEITAAHGNKGAVRARFERGLPGQAVFSNVVVQ